MTMKLKRYLKYGNFRYFMIAMEINGGITMEKRIAVLPGDGIGKEIIKGAIEILETIGERFHHKFSFTYGEIGGSAN